MMMKSGHQEKMIHKIRGESGLTLDYTTTCTVCGNWFHFDTVFDAYFCDPCDEWASNKCSDTQCSQCDRRPKRPSHVLDL